MVCGDAIRRLLAQRVTAPEREDFQPLRVRYITMLTRSRRRSAIAKQYKLSPQRRGKPFIGRSTLAARIDERERAREGAAWRVVRYTTARDDAPCINGDDSSSCSFEEPATAPSPPVLRMCIVCGLSLLALCCHRGSPRQSEKIFNPYEFYITMLTRSRRPIEISMRL